MRYWFYVPNNSLENQAVKLNYTIGLKNFLTLLQRFKEHKMWLGIAKESISEITLLNKHIASCRIQRLIRQLEKQLASPPMKFPF